MSASDPVEKTPDSAPEGGRPTGAGPQERGAAFLAEQRSAPPASDSAADTSRDGFALFEADGRDGSPRLRLVHGNAAARAALGLESGDRLGPCLAPRPSARIWSLLWDAIVGSVTEMRDIPAEAEPAGRWDVTVAPAGPGRAVVTWRDGDADTVDREATEPTGMGERAVTHDLLTGLPNGALLRGRLADALAACRVGHRVAVVFCTLNGLAEAAGNRYGAVVGEGLLRVTAERLTRRLRSGDIVARIAADTFVLVLRLPTTSADSARLLDRLTEVLSRPLVVHSTILAPSPSMGLLVADPIDRSASDRDPDSVLLRAYEAMQRSKVAGEPVLADEPSAVAEQARLAALKSYAVHQRGLDEIFLSVTRLAAASCGTPCALISFMDGDLEWVRTSIGLHPPVRPGARGPRHLSLCDDTIRGRSVLVLRDLRRDPRCSSKHVSWQRDMAFYAGSPLIDREGRAIGALSVMDTAPRDLSSRQQHSLTNLAEEVMGVLESRRAWRR